MGMPCLRISSMMVSLRSASSQCFKKLIERGEFFLDRSAGVVAKGFCDELAVFVEVLMAFGDDADADIAHYIFRAVPRRLWRVSRQFRLFRRDRRASGARLIDLNRVAIEIGVGERVVAFLKSMMVK